MFPSFLVSPFRAILALASISFLQKLMRKPIGLFELFYQFFHMRSICATTYYILSKSNNVKQDQIFQPLKVEQQPIIAKVQ